MGRFEISLCQLSLVRGDTRILDTDDHHALWQQSGALAVGGEDVSTGEGCYSEGDTIVARENGVTLVFTVSSPGATTDALLAAEFDWAGEAVLRLDQVSFPPGARAFRHVHPGPGIRFLTEGELEIRSDHHTEVITPGSAWFENANSPVQATAGPMPTAFVRAMILPTEFFGQPTLRLLNPEDEAKPRLQENRRFLDQKLCLRAG